MIGAPQDRQTEKAPSVVEIQLSSVRQEIIRRAGRMIRPQGKLVLSMSENEAVKDPLPFLK